LLDKWKKAGISGCEILLSAGCVCGGNRENGFALPPALGEQTEQILKTFLNLSAQEIEELREKKII
jgi:crotonobetainyl-CoA:carnitine CoA-transferase CaiB-like acyl-CoA transferase